MKKLLLRNRLIQKYSRQASHTFTLFDTESFYPSISEEQPTNAIHFAKKHTEITNHDINIIMHSRKSILLHNESPWVKKCNDGLFDVTMGSFDGAGVCDLVGLFILNDLANKYGTNKIGHYRTPSRKDTERNNKALQGTRTENNNSKQLKIS